MVLWCLLCCCDMASMPCQQMMSSLKNTSESLVKSPEFHQSGSFPSIVFRSDYLSVGCQISMKKLTKQPIDAIVTTDAMVAEGALSYLNENKLNIPIITFDSVKPKINIEAYVDINALELGRESFHTLLQIISDNKDGKQVCYRHVIPHSIKKLQ